MTANARSQKWDIVKFALIFLVVLGHVADYYAGSHEHIRSLIFIIYIFHMPLFIFVSGLFSKKTVENKAYDKLLGYLVIYVAIKLILHFFKIFVGRTPEFNLFVEGGAPWFMLALFFFNLITILVRKVRPAVVLSVGVVLACVAGFFPFIRDFLAVSRIFVFFPFFYLGYCTDRAKLESFCKGKAKKIIAVLILVAVCVAVFVAGDEIYKIRYLLTGKNPYETLGVFAPYGLPLRLAYYAVATIVSLCFIIIIPDRTPKGIVAKLGQRTLAVYVLHYTAIYLVFEYFKLKPVFENLIGRYDEWIAVPLSVLITLLFSFELFNTAMIWLMNLPPNIITAIKNKQSAH